MNSVITVKRRDVYGNEVLYVTSEHAAAISKLTGRKTVTYNDVLALKALGFEFKLEGAFLESQSLIYAISVPCREV